MKIEDLKELHYITHIDNLLSIIKNGILCNDKSKTIQHVSVADTSVQERRAKFLIPGGNRLHSYANLYFNGRNAMMFVLVHKKCQHKELVVIRVNIKILSVPNVVFSDRNASSIEYVRFFKVQEGLEKLNWELVFARYWNDQNLFRYYEKKSIRLFLCNPIN